MLGKQKTFTCAMCGCTGICSSEGEALAELKEEFGDIDPGCCVVVCDDCWGKVRPKNNLKIVDKDNRWALA
ncbi:MAG: hypothetical protein SV375_13700 [Thermodesulfobacteriota bacterium]|nr:hypothetical protein [Thermodesulfobacteriota bacterium]